MIKIIIIYSNEIEKDALEAQLSSKYDFDVIGSSASSYDAIRLIETKKPNIVLMDADLENENAVDLIPLFKAKSPQTGIIILDAVENEKHIRRFIMNKVSGYLIKGRDADILCYAIREVAHGGCFLSAKAMVEAVKIVAPLVKKARNPPNKPDQAAEPKPHYRTLSRIEMQIIALIAAGLSTKEIAERFSITNGTVRNYISAIMKKVGVQNRGQLILFALETGLVSLS